MALSFTEAGKPEITRFRLVQEGSAALIEFRALPGLRYTLKQSTDLSSWEETGLELTAKSAAESFSIALEPGKLANYYGIEAHFPIPEP